MPLVKWNRRVAAESARGTVYAHRDNSMRHDRYWYRLNALSFQRKLESSINASLSGFLLAQE